MLRGGRKKGRCRGKESGSDVKRRGGGGGGRGSRQGYRGVGDACAITREYPLVHHYTRLRAAFVSYDHSCHNDSSASDR